MMRFPSISRRIESHLLEAKFGSMHAVLASTFCSISCTNLKKIELKNWFFFLPILEPISLDGSYSTDCLTKPAVYWGTCSALHSPKLARSSYIDFL